MRRGIERFTRAGVVFADDTQEKRFDAVILATGYRPAVSFLENVSAVTDEEGNPRCSGRSTGLSGLYFCGFHVSPTGMLREIAMEARNIARSIARKRAGGQQTARGRPAGLAGSGRELPSS